MESYSAIKKNEIIVSVAICMDLEIRILSEMSDKDKYVLLIYVECRT